MQIVGQEFTLNLFEDWIRTTSFPHTLILVGHKGSGKTLISHWMAEHMGADVKHITELKIDNMREVIQDTLTLAKPKMYIIENAHKLNVNAQNAVLKLLEEPPEFAYFALLTENPDLLLPTIRSRSIIWALSPYKQSELKQFTEEQWILDVAETPGQVKEILANEEQFQELNVLAQTVATKIVEASLANVFNIAKRVEEGQIEIFFNTLAKQYTKQLLDKKRIVVANQCITLIHNYKDILLRSNVTNVKVLEMLCVELWRVERNGL